MKWSCGCWVAEPSRGPEGALSSARPIIRAQPEPGPIQRAWKKRMTV